MSEVGVSPRLVTEVVVVFRTFPIRVAGEQAGPLRDEITWEQLQSESRYPYSIEERTTVTNKIRRVARFDWELAHRAIRNNRPTKIAITGLDYLSFSNRGVTRFSELEAQARSFVMQAETRLGAPVRYVSSGPAMSAMTTLPDLQKSTPLESALEPVL